MNDVVRMSMVFKKSRDLPPSKIIKQMSQEKINLVYLSYINNLKTWGLTLAVNSQDKQASCAILKPRAGRSFHDCAASIILSIFPHRKNPEIPGSLLEIFGREEIEIDALTNSPSAISVILDESLLNKASRALFEPFTFSSYRTPADWKLAQKGKEELYKEVVASYQEKRPKVYGLEYHEEQEFIRLNVNSDFIEKLGRTFMEYAGLGFNLTFLAMTPQDKSKEGLAAFCFPYHESRSSIEILEKSGLKTDISATNPVTVFSMNGPHFGDRYGLASEIMECLQNVDVQLLGLSCTIASITGVIPFHDFEKSLDSIQSRFDVPNIIKKG